MIRKVLPYKEEYRSACIEIFKTNIGPFFAEDELGGFEDFLDNHVGATKYFVVFSDDEIIGCGGFYLKKGVVRLREGMIKKQNHKTGAGLLLLEYRLNMVREEYPDKKIAIDTTQNTEGFFKKYGFVTTKVARDFYAIGLDKVSMEYSA
jgi:predicted GNAT family N-acyltransferase